MDIVAWDGEISSVGVIVMVREKFDGSRWV